MSSSTDNFVLKGPINADHMAGHIMMKPQLPSRRRHIRAILKKESQQLSMEADRNFLLGLSDIKMSIFEYWRNKDSAAKKAECKDREDECWSPLCKSKWDNSGSKIQEKVLEESEEARLGVRLWKPCEWLWNINGQSVRIENSKLIDNVAAMEGWVSESREDLPDVKNVTSEGAVVVMKNEKAYAAGTQQACGALQDKADTSSSAVVWEGAAKGYAVK
jgi:hypothetical protein